MTRRVWVIAGGLLLLAFGLSWWLEHRTQPPSVELAVAAKVDTIRVQEAAKAETVYVAAVNDAKQARVSVRTLRDTLRITDTLEVKAFVARVDTALVKDSVALARADTTIAAEKAVTAAVREELAIALRPHPAPRLMTTVAGLYDPMAATPAGSVQMALRVIGSLAIIARADQRFVVGERPRSYLGLSLTF